MSSKKRKTPETENEEKETVEVKEDEEEEVAVNAVAAAKGNDAHVDEDDNDDSSDDDLILEGVVVRNHDVSDEDDYEDDDCEDDNDDNDNDDNDPTTTTATDTPTNNVSISGDRNTTTNRMKSNNDDDDSDKVIATTHELKQPSNNSHEMKHKKKKKKPRKPDDDDDDDDDILNVDFTFCDMDEKYFHGIKSVLHSSSPFYHPHSSSLSDLMIDNVTIGTVVSTSMEDVHEPDVFGFASVLNLNTYQQQEAIQSIQQFCVQHCPDTSQTKELELCCSGTTKRPVGLLLHGRMINMPMEIVYVLHEQLVQDMDWAIAQTNTDDTEDERKAHDFGAFLRLAPAERDHKSNNDSSNHSMILYKYFDDEIFQARSEFHFVVDVTSSASHSGMNQSSRSNQCIVVMVLTKTGHRLAMNDLKQLIHGR